MPWVAAAATVVGGLIASDSASNTANAAKDAANAARGAGAPHSAKLTTQGDKFNAIGDAQQSKYQSLYAPVENQYVSDAQNIDSVENQNLAAGEAGSQVRSSYDKAAQAQSRNLASMGINPNSGRALDAGNQIDMSRAADEAGAMNAARLGVRDRGVAMRTGVVAQGNNVSNQSLQAIQAGTSAYGNAGNLAIGTATAGTNAFSASSDASARSAQTTQDIIKTAANAYGSYKSAQTNPQTQNDGYGTTQENSDAWRAASSKKLKTDKKPVSDVAALEKVKKIPVESWKYKKGVADEGAHIGPYAEDVNKQFGAKAAPDGKKIDLISMNGITLSAVKGLAKEVDRLKSAVRGITLKGA
jgi:hypothetical protein